MKEDALESMSDAPLSRAYEAMATERVPDALNDKILAAAAADIESAQPARGLFAQWGRPLGWAATIALSLGIVLQATQPPGAPSEPGITESDSVAAHTRELTQSADVAVDQQDNVATFEPAARSMREDFAPQSQETIEEAKKLARLQAGPNRSAPEARVPSAATPADASQARLEKSDANRAANSRQRNTEAPAALLDLADEDAVSKCDAPSRLDPVLWTNCIDELRESGEFAAADNEEQLLRIEFPTDATE